MPRKRVAKEPIQVYLDGRDRALLDALAKRENLPRSEVLRMALRRLGAGVAEGAAVGVTGLIGSLEGTSAPEDLAARHDEYLYAAPRRRKTRSR
jgi:hypothetical protein